MAAYRKLICNNFVNLANQVDLSVSPSIKLSGLRKKRVDRQN